MDIEKRVREYWTKRAHNFGIVRHNELHGNITGSWLDEILAHLPAASGLKILDVGTGTGYFAIILTKQGHELTGIDITPAMIDEAKKLAESHGTEPRFLVMDAQSTSFEDESFDAIITRNLTWTLPEPEKAYREWYRLLKRNGVLLNFDADYAENVRNNNQKASRISSSDVYGHCGMTKELEDENTFITLNMPSSHNDRPTWDLHTLKQIGFRLCDCDISAGHRILNGNDLPDAPMFLIRAVK